MAVATKVTILRAHALALFAWCGWKSAENWSNEKLADKMNDVPEIAEGKQMPADELVAKTLIAVKAGVEDQSEFEVADGEVTAAATEEVQAVEGGTVETATSENGAAASADDEKAKADKAADKAKKEEEKAVKKAEREKAKADKAADREKAKADKAAEKAAEKAAKKESKEKKGVRDSATRGYFAGKVMFKHGLDKGITEEMIAEVDTMYGKPNHDVSRGALAWAYSGLRGYFDAKAEAEGAAEKPTA
jgi:flagellar biosynthesis GTPase FlhF